ncbi:MAG TPA: amino acid-binding protein [Actinomycetota bacterium]|nr:amino acid-binding protein [Actinomycetota bacterium]
MATDLTIQLENRPGELARAAEALGNAGVNIDGGCATTAGGSGEVHLLFEDAAPARQALEGAGISVSGEREALVVDAPNQPGELGRTARRLADAGVNIEAYYVSTGDRLVFCVDDVEKARGAL